MKQCLLHICSLLIFSTIQAQDDSPHLLVDAESGCKVWYKHMFSEDSIHWDGPCVDGFAEGKGRLTGYTEGKETSTYIGYLEQGKPHGKGKFSFWGDRVLEGNFFQGEPLFLSKALLAELKKEVVATEDTSNIYVGDNNAKELYYHALIPKDNIQAVIVLLPGTWETTEHALSSMSTLCALAFEQDIAILVPSINQRITLHEGIIQLMNTMFEDAIKRYHLPKQHFILGGWSMGGLFSLRYGELAHENSSLTAVKPVAVFSCDGPCDLAYVYRNFKRKLHKNPGQNEPQYGLNELEKYCGGSPETANEKYIHYSCYSRNEADGGNAKYLKQTPVRIYNDVDPVWWMENRKVDMYDLNALDQTAMIQFLRDHGNKEAEFVHAFQQGYRLEGNRHPHSWSIIDPEECINWITSLLKKEATEETKD